MDIKRLYMGDVSLLSGSFDPVLYRESCDGAPPLLVLYRSRWACYGIFFYQCTGDDQNKTRRKVFLVFLWIDHLYAVCLPDCVRR